MLLGDASLAEDAGAAVHRVDEEHQADAEGWGEGERGEATLPGERSVHALPLRELPAAAAEPAGDGGAERPRGGLVEPGDQREEEPDAVLEQVRVDGSAHPRDAGGSEHAHHAVLPHGRPRQCGEPVRDGVFALRERDGQMLERNEGVPMLDWGDRECGEEDVRRSEAVSPF